MPKPRNFDNRKIKVDELFQKMPPHAPEAECALLGSMILDWRVCGEVIQIIKSPEEFYKPSHGTIYEALVRLYDEKQSIDMVQLNQVLEDSQQIKLVGGVDYLIELAESVPSASSAAYYARIVHEKHLARQLIEACSQALWDAYNADMPVMDLLDKSERALFGIAETNIASESVALKDLLQDTYTDLENRDGVARNGLETGFYELDDILNGLQPGEMIIIAARPSIGKTALALNMAEHISANNKIPTAVFSLEMGRLSLGQRLICSRSGVDSHRLRRNMLSKDEFTQLAIAVSQLQDSPMHIDDTPALTLLALRAKARRLAMRNGIKAIFIDYMQLMSEPGHESRQQEISAISRGLKALARELNIPVVVLSQLNRKAEDRTDHRPRMSDLRESGSIEQDADVVMMLHREDAYHKGEEDHVDTNVAELIVAKQRNGPTGVVKLQFNGGSTRFKNLAHNVNQNEELYQPANMPGEWS